jgi:energy-converting hydrogenase Eha subunit H
MTSKRIQFTSSRQNFGSVWGRNQNLTALTQKTKVGPIFSTIAVIGIVAILSLIYLFQITKTSTYSFELENIERQRAELISEREDLRNENARMQSAQRVNSAGVAASMTTPASIEYAN